MPPATRTRTATRKKPVVISEEGDVLDGATGEQRLRDEAALELHEDDPEYDDFDVEDAEVPDTLVFTSDTDAKEKRDTDPGTVFEFDGRRFRAFKPKDTVMVTLIAASSSTATVADQVDAVLKWLDHCLEPAAKMHLQNRLYDRDDKIEWDDLASVMLALLEYWDDSGRMERRRRKQAMRERTDAANARAGRGAEGRAAVAGGRKR
jgi:hypothetical protein